MILKKGDWYWMAFEVVPTEKGNRVSSVFSVTSDGPARVKLVDMELTIANLDDQDEVESSIVVLRFEGYARKLVRIKYHHLVPDQLFETPSEIIIEDGFLSVRDVTDLHEGIITDTIGVARDYWTKDVDKKIILKLREKLEKNIQYLRSLRCPIP